MGKLWKLYYADGTVIRGTSLSQWRAAPPVGVQILAVKLDPELDEKSRVLYYRDDYYLQKLSPTAGLWHGCAFYRWVAGYPAGVTPDSLLDAYYEATGKTDVTVGDLSIHVIDGLDGKCGRSTSNEEFKRLLQQAVNDPEIS